MFKNLFGKKSEPVQSEEQVQEVVEETPKQEGFLSGFFKGLTKTRDNISKRIDEVLSGYVKIDDEMYEDLEDTLVSADIGMDATLELIDELREVIREKKITDPSLVKGELGLLLKDLMRTDEAEGGIDLSQTPMILLVVGVNGVGKTTSIGKLAAKFKAQGKSVQLAAADTFRAAAIDQLREWANRAKVEIIAQSEGSDPAAVIFDGIASAKSKGTDILICDTAGRLHNKKNLMQELNKIHRIIEREYPEAKKQTLLVLDATTGQNALSQAKEFKEVADISGVILTKLDGTAKGGVVVRIVKEYGIPVRYIGLGEGIDDLMEFDAEEFVDSII